MLCGFSHVMLYVHDVQRAADWYAENLGFTPKFISGHHYGIMVHERMHLRLDLHPDRHGGHNVGHGAQVYFFVENLDEAMMKLRDKKVEVGEPRREANSPRFCSFKDCEGNVLGLTERRLGEGTTHPKETV